MCPRAVHAPRRTRGRHAPTGGEPWWRCHTEPGARRGLFPTNLGLTRGSRRRPRAGARGGWFQAALDSAWGTRTLGDLLASGKKVLITSYSVSAGQARIFKTDHSSQLSLHNRYRVADVALASAAAPTYFPLACVVDPATGLPEMFCDGGVVANHPALLGFAEAVFELKIAPRDVKVLSVSTPRTDLAAPSTGSFDRGLYGCRCSLPAILVDSPSNISHQLLRRLVASYGEASPIYERVDLRNPSQLPFDRADAVSTQELLLIGTKEAASNEVRNRLMPFWIDPTS